MIAASPTGASSSSAIMSNVTHGSRSIDDVGGDGVDVGDESGDVSSATTIGLTMSWVVVSPSPSLSPIGASYLRSFDRVAA